MDWAERSIRKAGVMDDSDFVEDVPAREPGKRDSAVAPRSPRSPRPAPRVRWLKGTGIGGRPLPETYKEGTQERLALIIVIGVLLLDSLVICAFIFGWVSSDESLSSFMISISGLQTLAAGVVGFYFGEIRATSGGADAME